MGHLRESWHRLRYGLLIMTVALASGLAVAPTAAMASAWDAPVVLTENAH